MFQERLPTLGNEHIKSAKLRQTNFNEFLDDFVVKKARTSSIGRARALHARGTGIDAWHLHRLSSATCFERRMFLSKWHFIISSWWSILYWKLFNYGRICHLTLCHIERRLVQRDKMRPMSARCKLAASCKNVKSFICPIICRLPVCTWLLFPCFKA